MKLSVKKFTHNDITVEYMEGGSGKTILFLPGGIRAGVYEENVLLLAKKFHVIIPDLPGFGNATVPKTIWGLSDYGAFFSQFIKELKLTHVNIIGHSLGGGSALALSRTDKNIDQIILFGAAGIKPPFPKTRFLQNLLVKKTWYDLRHAKSLFLKALLMNNALSTIGENLLNVFHLAKIAEKCIYSNLKDLEKISCPVILLWGDKDELFPLVCAETLKKRIPNVTLKVVDGNHDWCVLDPKKSTDLLLGYLC